MRAIVTVVGKDQIGIIARVCTLLAENGANVIDISQTVQQGFFTMVMFVDLSKCDKPFTELADTLLEDGKKIGMSIRMQREDIFEAMHRI